MPKPRKGGGGGWGIQSVVNGWINVNEHQLAPDDIHKLQQQQAQEASTSEHGTIGLPAQHPPGAAAIAAAASDLSAAASSALNRSAAASGTAGQSQRPAGRAATHTSTHGRRGSSNRYSDPGSAISRSAYSYSYGHHGHHAAGAGANMAGGAYPSSSGGPVPGDGRVILGRRESTDPDLPGGSSKWGPEPVPLSPEASPMMAGMAGGGSGNSMRSQQGPSRQPPHLGLDASSSTQSHQSRSNHSHSTGTGGGSRNLGSLAGNSQFSGSYRANTGTNDSSNLALQLAGEHRKSSMKTHITSATEENMTVSDGHQSSNFSSSDTRSVTGGGSSTVGMSLLSSPYSRRHSGLQYDGPAAPASVGNVLGSGIGTGAAGAAPASAAAGRRGELTSTAPSTAATALNSTNFASQAHRSSMGKRRSSTAYQSSELDYSTSAGGGSLQFGMSPYMNSRRASALTELTVSTIPSRRDSGSPPEEEQQYHPRLGGGDGSVSMRSGKSAKSSSTSTVGSSTSRTTTKSRKKERNALRRTNSQSDILKVMAGGGTGQTHLSLEEKSMRKSDAFLRKVHEMQVQQRQKLIAVQEAEELRLQHHEGDGQQPPLQQHMLHQYPTAGRSDRSLSVSGSVSGSGTSGSVTVEHSNTAPSVNSKGTGTSDNAQVQPVPQVHRETSAPAKADDASEDNSIQKFVSGILGMGGGSDDKAKQAQQQQASAEELQQQKQLLQQQVQLQQQQRGPTNTGQYLNEAAFVQHVERQRAAAMALQQQQEKQSSSSVAGSSGGGGGGGRSKKSSKGGSRRRSDDGLPLNSMMAVPSSVPENQRGLYPGQQPPLHPPQQQQQDYAGQSSHRHPPSSGTPKRGGGYVVTGPGVVQPLPPRPQTQHGHGTDSRSCAQCSVLEKQLMALQADLDYLRSIVVQNEFICAECEAPSSSKSSSKRRNSTVGVPSAGASVSNTKSKKSVSTSASRKGKKNKFGSSAQLSQLSGDADKPRESDALNDASQRLMAVASRHKRQIEHMTKETARWQNDMHLKLSKMSMMCKDLNDESAKRKEESTNIQATLAKVRADRNALQSEVESLRARIALYEKEDVENDRVSQALERKETTELDNMDNAIENRDGALGDMSSHLDRTLTSLEEERKRQKESQQALAQSSRKKSTSFNPASASETSFFNPLLGIARAARVDEDRAAHDEMAETSRKEDELQKRCEALEKELQAAQEQLRKSAANA